MERDMNFKSWMTIDETTTLAEWVGLCMESTSSATRYSVEVNYRTTMKDAAESFAKIVLGYVSAAVKGNGYHVKHVYDAKPLRIMISSRNWDDGEWVAIVSWNPDHDGGSFIISKGFYNADYKTVSIQSSHKAHGSSAVEIVGEVRNLMHQIKGMKDRHQEKLKPALMKRGPKR